MRSSGSGRNIWNEASEKPFIRLNLSASWKGTNAPPVGIGTLYQNISSYFPASAIFAEIVRGFSEKS
jgi:hypothetical protein